MKYYLDAAQRGYRQMDQFSEYIIMSIIESRPHSLVVREEAICSVCIRLRTHSNNAINDISPFRQAEDVSVHLIFLAKRSITVNS